MAARQCPGLRWKVTIENVAGAAIDRDPLNHKQPRDAKHRGAGENEKSDRASDAAI